MCHGLAKHHGFADTDNGGHDFTDSDFGADYQSVRDSERESDECRDDSSVRAAFGCRIGARYFVRFVELSDHSAA